MEERSVMARTTNTAKPRIFCVIYKIMSFCFSRRLFTLQ
jgi:hypothetical protein